MKARDYKSVLISWRKLPVIGLIVATAFPFFTHAVNAQEALEQRTIVRMGAWSVVRKQDPFTDFVMLEAQNFSEDGVLVRILCSRVPLNSVRRDIESAGVDIGEILRDWLLYFHWPDSDVDFSVPAYEFGERPDRETAWFRVEGLDLMRAELIALNDFEHDDIPGPMILVRGYETSPYEFTSDYSSDSIIFNSLLIKNMIENDGARLLARFFTNGPSGQFDVAFDTTGIAQAIEPLLEHCEY